MFGGSRRSSRCEPPKVRAIGLDHFAVRRRCCFTQARQRGYSGPGERCLPHIVPRRESQGREVRVFALPLEREAGEPSAEIAEEVEDQDHRQRNPDQPENEPAAHDILPE